MDGVNYELVARGFENVISMDIDMKERKVRVLLSISYPNSFGIYLGNLVIQFPIFDTSSDILIRFLNRF